MGGSPQAGLSLFYKVGKTEFRLFPKLEFRVTIRSQNKNRQMGYHGCRFCHTSK
jgi:hypothetical protein